MEDVAPTSAQPPVDSQEGGDPMEEDAEENGFGEEEPEEPQRVRIVSFFFFLLPEFSMEILNLPCPDQRIGILATGVYEYSGIL